MHFLMNIFGNRSIACTAEYYNSTQHFSSHGKTPPLQLLLTNRKTAATNLDN